MTREIKFRAWDGKKMINGFHIWSFSDQLRNRLLDSKERILMQYTGLKDKNGKEVWEGDLVNVGEKLFQIGWHAMAGGFWLMSVAPAHTSTGGFSSSGAPARDYNFLDGGKSVYWHGIQKSEEMEVIGNVWEHPDLLTKQN